MRKQIKNVDILGDSLTDRADLADDKLLGVIPMSWLSGLSDKSTSGRFTNGYVWSDFFGVRFAQESGFLHPNLNNPARIKTETGNTIVRTFAKGGLTANNWATRITFNPKLIGTQMTLSTLDEQREAMFEDDKNAHITPEEKKSHLVIEWSGANDIVTVNDEVRLESAQKAVVSRINNIEFMIKNGYQHFCLINLPDISLSPRFQRCNEEERKRAKAVTDFFNQELSTRVEILNHKYQGTEIDVFNTNSLFSQLHDDPASLGFNPALISQPLTETDTFKAAENKKTVDATGYAYWDDVHPTTAVQFLFSQHIYAFLEKKYELFATPETLVNIFREHYGREFASDTSNCFGFFYISKIDHLKKNLTLEQVFHHALFEKGERTARVLKNLGWLDQTGSLSQPLNLHIATARKSAGTTQEEKTQQPNSQQAVFA